jgi:hypothetical protein
MANKSFVELILDCDQNILEEVRPSKRCSPVQSESDGTIKNPS